MFDHWLLVEMRGSDPALTGQKLLVVACGLRARLGALLSGALVEAEKRKMRTGGGGGRFGEMPGDREGEEHERSQDRSQDRRGAPHSETPGEEEGEGGVGGGLQDVPPLLIRARRAWLEGGKLGGKGERGREGNGGDENGGGGDPRAAKRWQRQGQEQQWQGQGQQCQEKVVDWAQEAEDLAVDLAEFMLQTIG